MAWIWPMCGSSVLPARASSWRGSGAAVPLGGACARAAKRSWAATNWPRIRALTAGGRGVSGRAMRLVRTGTSGAYFRASRAALGPLVWIRPTPLSVKSDALITRAHGFPARLSATCSRYCWSRSAPGCVLGVGDRVDQAGDPRAETRGQRGDRGGPAARGQAVGIVLDRVVEQGGADHVDVVDAVVADDPQRHAQQVIDVRLTLTPVGGMQIPGELQRPGRLLAGGRVREPGDLGGEPGPQPLLAVHGRDRVQRHHRDQLQIRLIDGTAAARRPAVRAGPVRAAALPVSRLPGPDQLAPGTENPVAGLRHRERGELVTALQAAQVTSVVPRQAAQPGQGQPALVPAGAQLRAPPVNS